MIVELCKKERVTLKKQAGKNYRIAKSSISVKICKKIDFPTIFFKGWGVGIYILLAYDILQVSRSRQNIIRMRS